MQSTFPSINSANLANSFIIPAKSPEWFLLWHRTTGLIHSLGVNKKIHPQVSVRTAIQYNRNSQQLYAKKDLEYAVGSASLSYSIHDFEIPVDIKYDIKSWLQVFTGLSANFRLNAHKPDAWYLGPPDERWPIQERKENLNAVKDFFIPFLIKYRFGLGIKPFQRVTVEGFYQHPFGKVAIENIDLRGELYPVDISYGDVVFRVLYKFRLPFLSKQEG